MIGLKTYLILSYLCSPLGESYIIGRYRKTGYIATTRYGSRKPLCCSQQMGDYLFCAGLVNRKDGKITPLGMDRVNEINRLMQKQS